MPTDLSPRITEYFSRNDAASQWWNIDYKTGGRYGKQIEFIRKNIKITGSKALDVATGLGRFAIEFACSSANEVVAVDIAQAMIDLAGQNAAQHGVQDKIRFMVGDAANLNFSESYFDIVSLMEVLVHLPEPGKVVGDLSKYLKSGGYFITNYDLPRAPKVTYPIDWAVSTIRGILRNKLQRDVVMMDTVDETLEVLDKKKQKSARVMRPKDAYRGLSDAFVNDILAKNDLTVEFTLKEYASFLGVTIPIPIGRMIIAKKR